MKENVNRVLKKHFEVEIEGYVKELEGFLRLDLGESLEGPNPAVLDALKDMSLQELGEYPDSSNKAVKQAFSEFLCVPSDNITVGNGTDEIIENLARLFIDPGDKVILPIPTFYRLEDASSRAGANIEFIQIQGLRFDQNTADRIIDSARKETPKILWLCSPINPTGQIIKKSLIEQILLAASDSVVVVDEAYMGFTGEQDSNVDLVERYPNLIVLRSMSKSFGLAGLRCGVGVAQPQMTKLIEKFRATFPVNSVAQRLVPIILADQDYIDKVNAITTKRRERIFKKFEGLGLGFARSSTNTVLARHPTKDLYEELLARKIAVADFRNCRGIEGKGYVRITIGSDEDIDKLFSSLEEICKDLE